MSEQEQEQELTSFFGSAPSSSHGSQAKRSARAAKSKRKRNVRTSQQHAAASKNKAAVAKAQLEDEDGMESEDEEEERRAMAEEMGMRWEGQRKRKQRAGEAEESDSDADQESEQGRRAERGAKRQRLSAEEEEERTSRTVFVGNVSVSTKRKALKRVFSEHGEVESVRFRSIPIADGRMDRSANAKSQNFHPKRTSMNAYVVFATREEAEAAQVLNGTVLNEKHLRVDMADKERKLDNKRTVFVGNLAPETEEEDLWEAFGACGEITAVRVVRDKDTNICKGIAFVEFDTEQGSLNGLAVKGTEVCGREVRVMPSKEQKKKKKNGVGGNQKGSGKGFEGTRSRPAIGASLRIEKKLKKKAKAKRSGNLAKEGIKKKKEGGKGKSNAVKKMKKATRKAKAKASAKTSE